VTSNGSNPPRAAERPQRLRLGIIGCGAITETAHLPAALSSPLIELTALSDPNPARLEYLLRLHGLPPIGFSDHRSVLDRVDAVVLALPNHLHAPIGEEFLDRRIHVLCEKPLAPTSAACERLCRAARANSAVLAVGFVTRFFPSTKLLKRLIDSRFLGALRSFEYEYGAAGGWAPLSGYNLSRQTSGGGVLVVSGSHFIDRLLYLFGEARLLRFEDDSRGGIEANCLAEFETVTDGRPIHGVVRLSKTHSASNRLRITGEKGILEVGEGQTNSVKFFPTDESQQHEITCAATPEAKEDYFRVQLEDFVRTIHDRADPLITGEQGWASVALMEECYRQATRLQEPWVEATLERLRAALPATDPGAQAAAAQRQAARGILGVS
jgi:predicted dehydrogenase